MPSDSDRIDIILADRKCYTFEGYASKEVSSCLTKRGADHRLLYIEDGLFSDYLNFIKETPPKWTLSFSHWSTFEKPLCDIVQIPHFFWLEGSFAEAIPYLQTNFGKVGISDRALCQKLSSPQCLFLPHGVKPAPCASEKELDVVLFAHVADPLLVEKIWEKSFSKEEITSITRAVELKDPLEAQGYFLFVEEQILAVKTLEIVSQFKQAKLDVFGKHVGNNWLLRLGQNIRLHANLPYTECFEVLKLSKIALIEKEDPWYWPAIASHCLPLPPHEEEVLFFLHHEEERKEKLRQLQKNLPERSWENQVDLLLRAMP